MSARPDEPKGWYSRGYLPHLDTPGLLQGVTFHLGDSLPRHVLGRLRAEAAESLIERQRTMERLLDAGYGACWLGRPEIARLVEDALLHFDGIRYRLLCWTVMPNHVHALIETLPGHPLYRVVQGWKGFTAFAANRLLGRSGAFWARDYFDRYVRDDRHLAAVVRYIDNNPVKARLAESPEGWPFGSARRRASAANNGAAPRAD